MSSEHWNAMVESANLCVAQQRIISKYLTYYFGKRIVVSEKEMLSVNNTFVLYQKCEYEISSGHLVKI